MRPSSSSERGSPGWDPDRSGQPNIPSGDGTLREAPKGELRIGVDMSILRHPLAGTARYAVELLSAMQSMAAPSETLIPVAGLPRAGRGYRVRRYLNLASDLVWWSMGAVVTCAAKRLDAWFSPANTLPLALPRGQVVTIHDANFLVCPDAYDPGYRSYAELMFRHSAAHADRILTDSHWSARQLETLLGAPPERIVVAYPGLDQAFRVAPARRDPAFPPTYALFVGQTEPHKNVGVLLEAWRTGVPRGLHLVIAGRAGRDDERLRALVARDRMLRELVHFEGGVDEPRLARLYEDATCFLFPSRTEGFGFPPLEAMARGVPTAVANSGSLPEVTDGGALIFDPDDPDGVADICLRLTNDAAERERLAETGRRVAGRYVWRETAQAAWRAIREVRGV
jgi:glycosyltransferase involved in cell wall biosynthesis